MKSINTSLIFLQSMDIKGITPSKLPRNTQEPYLSQKQFGKDRKSAAKEKEKETKGPRNQEFNFKTSISALVSISLPLPYLFLINRYQGIHRS